MVQKTACVVDYYPWYFAIASPVLKTALRDAIPVQRRIDPGTVELLVV